MFINIQELYAADIKKEKDPSKKKKGLILNDLVSEESLERNYQILGKVCSQLLYFSKLSILVQGDGVERLLIKDKKEQLDEKDGDSFKYFLLAGI